MAWRKGSAHATTKPSDPLISIFLGQFGIDRFFVGDTMMGVLKLITCGGCGIWTIIDWFLIMGVTKDKNYARFNGIF